MKRLFKILVLCIVLFFLRPSSVLAEDGYWETVGEAGFSEGSIQDPSLFVDNGIIYMAYKEMSNGQKATVKMYNGTDWVFVGDRGFSVGKVYDMSMYVYNGTPYVVYRETVDRDRYKATVKMFDGTSWVTVGDALFSTGYAYDPEIFVYEGTPYVVYRDASCGSKATVKMFDGTSWVTVGTEGFTEDSVNYTKIFVYNGIPYVGYQDSSNDVKATVKMFDGTDWVTVGDAGFSAGAAHHTSLYIYDNVVYFAYLDTENDGKATVKKNNGTGWQTVGTEGFSAGRAYYLYLSMNDGIPYLAYTDDANGQKATVVKYNGTDWETVGNEGFSPGQVNDTSLCVYDGIVYAAFRDYSNSYGTTAMKFIPTYSVTYDANGGINAPASAGYEPGDIVIVSSQGSMSNDSNVFLGWNSSQIDANNGIVQYSPTSSVPSELYFGMPANNITLYAVWGTPSPEPIIFETIGIASGEIVKDYNYMMINDPLSLGGPGLYAAIEDVLENQRIMLADASFAFNDAGLITNKTSISNPTGFYANNGNTVQLNPSDIYETHSGFSVRQYSTDPYGAEIVYLQNIPYAGFTESDFEMNTIRIVTQTTSSQVFSPVLPSINIEVIGVVQKDGSGWFNQLDVTVDDPNYYVLRYNYGPTDKADEVPNFFEVRRVSDDRVEALYNGNHSTFTFYNYETTYTVTYEDGVVDETIIVPTDNNEYSAGATATISTDEPTRTGHAFVGWLSDISADSTIYKTGTSNNEFTMPASAVTLTAVWNKLPDAIDDTYTTNEETTLIVVAPGVMTNDTLGDGTNEVTVDVDVTNGTLELNTDGSFEYIPDIDFAGADTFTYTIKDENEDTDTATVTITVVDMAEELILTPEEAIIEVGDTLPMTVELLPIGTSHEQVAFTSSNPSVATIDASGVVSGVSVGRVVITATSGVLSDTSVIEVWSTDLDDPNLPRIRVEGDIFYTTDETPIPGIDMTLYSTPIRSTSNSDGYFYLGYTYAGTHTLTAEISPGSEIGRVVPITFTRGATESYLVHADGSVDVTFTDETDLIYLRLEIPRSTGILGVRDVDFIHDIAVNPRTGDDSTWWEIILQWLGNFFGK